MARKDESVPTWAVVKKAIEAHGRDELVKLVGDLYRLSKANRQFLHMRFSLFPDPLKHFKQVIDESIYPDMYSERPIRISRAKGAIAEYKRAVGDSLGEADLLVYFAECGAEVGTRYGDMPDSFCSSVVDAYRLAIKNVKSLPVDTQAPFRERLEKIKLSTKKAGWAFQDCVIEAFDNAFGQDDLEDE